MAEASEVTKIRMRLAGRDPLPLRAPKEISAIAPLEEAIVHLFDRLENAVSSRKLELLSGIRKDCLERQHNVESFIAELKTNPFGFSAEDVKQLAEKAKTLKTQLSMIEGFIKTPLLNAIKAYRALLTLNKTPVKLWRDKKEPKIVLPDSDACRAFLKGLQHRIQEVHNRLIPLEKMPAPVLLLPHFATEASVVDYVEEFAWRAKQAVQLNELREELSGLEKEAKGYLAVPEETLKKLVLQLQGGVQNLSHRIDVLHKALSRFPVGMPEESVPEPPKVLENVGFFGKKPKI